MVSLTPLEPLRRIDDPTIIQEELRFASAIPLRLEEAAQAKAYVFRHGPLGERPTLLFVPGQNINWRDYASFDSFFEQALARDMDVVFFVPPYHLSRTPAGYGSGDAFLATDFIDHLRAFAQELSDLRALTAWLRERGVRDLGAFGGSMGGTMVLRLIGWAPIFDFVIAMQPVVDWNALILRPEMAPVRARLREQGVSDEDVMLAYHAIDPRTATAPRLSSQRITLLYGRYDLIAAEGPLLSLKRQWSIGRVRVYDRGHAFLTVGGRPSRDFGLALEMDLRALRWRRYILDLIERPTW
ncbi:MAG: prolyl oligopeptidase family serine peptidase [Myxococcales bacterium]